MSSLTSLGTLSDFSFGGPGSNFGAGPAVSGVETGDTSIGGLTINRDAGVSLPGGSHLSGTMLTLITVGIVAAVALRRR